MADDIYDTLYTEGLLSDDSLAKTKQPGDEPLFHVHWEIKTLLYAGVLLLTAGLGILIYQNINSIGHQVVLLIIGLICTGSVVYCFKNKLPFSTDKVQSPNAYFDYILLLASISFLTFTGYLQFQYGVFGTHYGLATLIPMLVLFFVAYYFDHIGILSMAIVNLALWMGISVSPKQLLIAGFIYSNTIICTYLVLGVLLIAAALITLHFNVKKHFQFSYRHYGVHAAYIALLAGYYHNFDSITAAIWMIGLFALSVILYADAIKNKSFYFLMLVILYSYIAISSLAVRVFSLVNNMSAVYLILLYFIASALGLIFLLIHFNKKLKAA